MKKRKIIDKQLYKKDKKCIFCKESDPALLDIHRINPGCTGGKYSEINVVCCCANCHRKIHNNEIKIEKKYFSTKGLCLIYYIDNIEYIVFENEIY